MPRVKRFANRSDSSMNTALWVAAGTAAGVIIGVSLTDRPAGRKLIRRLTGALAMFEGLRDQFDKIARRGVAAGSIRADDDLDDDDDDLDDDYDSVHDEPVSPAYAVGDDHDDFDTTENEGSGFEPDTDDNSIDERVLAAFVQDPILAERDIEIDEPQPAVIALSGRVGTTEDAEHAVTIARGVPGVERVENYLRVRNQRPASPPPEESDV